jgi:methyl-accepting chemotaxis protein
LLTCEGLYGSSQGTRAGPGVSNEAIDAIKGIGSIVGEVNDVATAIAAAVHEQGAATQEITRSTQFAAQGAKNVSDNISGVKTDADASAAAAEDARAKPSEGRRRL